MTFTDTASGLVKAVVACLPVSGWQAALLDYELREMPDGFDSDYVGIVLIKGQDGGLTQDQFQLDHQARQAAMALYHDRQATAADKNAGFVIRIEHTGDYRIEFKDKIKRLAGFWDQQEEEYIDQYLQHYLRETGTT